MANNQPNIIMIQADQLTALTLGCYGHPTAKTPNIDRMADEGVRFVNSYCNSPLCGPSRASMVTGRQPSQIASFDNASELPASVPTFMHLLRNVGYELWLSGKMHFVGPDQLHGFHGRTNTDIYPSNFEWTPKWGEEPYGNPATSVRYLHQSGPCRWSLQMDYDEETTGRGLRCLRDLVRRRYPKDEPFFLCISYTHPHDPFHIGQEYWDLYNENDVPSPSVPSHSLEEMHPYNQWLQIHHEVDKYPPGQDAIQAARHAYLGMVSYVDKQVGLILSEIERLGIGDDTLVVFTSDHGEMNGEHGMWFKRTFYERSMRVPLIFWQPKAFKTRTVTTLTSLVDLYPTFAELAGVRHGWADEDLLDGSSLVPFLNGAPEDPERNIKSEYLGEGVIQPMRMVRWKDYKYINVNGERPLLFDLAADPNEQEDRVDHVGYSQVEEKLQKMVAEDWGAQSMRDVVLKDQARRLMIKDAMRSGCAESWDYQPFVDASKEWIRFGFTVQEEKRRWRWPYKEES